MKATGQDQVYMYTLQDLITNQGTTNADATQLMWSANRTATQTGTSIVGDRQALHLDDPQVLGELAWSYIGSSAAGYSKICRKSYMASYKITNSQSSPVEIWEYRVRSRRDNGLTLDEVLALAFGSAATGTPAVAPTSPVVSTMVGATPFMSNPFVSQYHVLKVKKKIIMPGKWWKLSYKLKKPRVYDVQEFMEGTGWTGSTTATQIVAQRGNTLSLFVAKGTSVFADAANAGYTVGLSNIRLLIEHVVKVHYTAITKQNQTSTGGVQIAGFSAGFPMTIPSSHVVNWPAYTIQQGTNATATTVGTAIAVTTAGELDGAMIGVNDVPTIDPPAGPLA